MPDKRVCHHPMAHSLVADGGMASNMDWRGGELLIYLISNRGQPTRGGPPDWGLGEVPTTPHPENWPCFKTDTCASGLD